METLLMILMALLPLGLVALSAYLLIKRKMQKKPELKLVEEVVENAAVQAAKTQGAPSNLKKTKKKRSRKGKKK